MATSPIPILLCGKIPSHIAAVTEIVKPEAQIIKVCTSPEDAKTTITAVTSSSSPSGTTTAVIDGVEYPKPRVIIMGGGYTNDDFQPIYDGVDGARSVAWIRPAVTKPGSVRPPGPPPAEWVAASVRKILDEHIDELRRGAGAGEIWWMEFGPGAGGA